MNIHWIHIIYNEKAKDNTMKEHENKTLKDNENTLCCKWHLVDILSCSKRFPKDKFIFVVKYLIPHLGRWVLNSLKASLIDKIQRIFFFKNNNELYI